MTKSAIIERLVKENQISISEAVELMKNDTVCVVNSCGCNTASVAINPSYSPNPVLNIRQGVCGYGTEQDWQNAINSIATGH